MPWIRQHLTSGHSGVSIDFALEPRKHGIWKHLTCAAPALNNRSAVRGLESSRRAFAQNVFIQCESGNSPAKSLVLQPPQILELSIPMPT